MNAETIVIYRQTHTYKGHAFAVWSYLDDPDPQKSTMLYAFQVEGVTVAGIQDRPEAIRQARQRIDGLPAKPVEATPAADAPQANQGPQQRQQEQPQQAELPLV